MIKYTTYYAHNLKSYSEMLKLIQLIHIFYELFIIWFSWVYIHYTGVLLQNLLFIVMNKLLIGVVGVSTMDEYTEIINYAETGLFQSDL